MESLHNHTTTSDGKMTHIELLKEAEELGFNVVAFTDHDAVPDEAILAALEPYHGPVDWIYGIEMTSAIAALPHSKNGATVHVVGLFINPRDSALLAHCRKAQAARRERMEYIVGKLNTLGFHISEKDCLEESSGEAVGRPHIVAALGRYPENEALFGRIFSDMKTAASTDASVRARFEEMVSQGKRQYPYALVLSPDAFRSAYIEAKYVPTIAETTALIRGAGGVALLAHYSYDKPKLDIDDLRGLLRAGLLDGVEVVYGQGKVGTPQESQFEADKKVLRAMAGLNGGLLSGGADAHCTEDLRDFARNSDFASDSNGFASTLIDSGRVCVKNSSFGR